MRYHHPAAFQLDWTSRLNFKDFRAILDVPEEQTSLIIEEEPDIFDKFNQFPSYGAPFCVKCLADGPYEFALLASARVFPALDIQELVFKPRL